MPILSGPRCKSSASWKIRIQIRDIFFLNGPISTLQGSDQEDQVLDGKISEQSSHRNRSRECPALITSWVLHTSLWFFYSENIHVFFYFLVCKSIHILFSKFNCMLMFIFVFFFIKCFCNKQYYSDIFSENT